MKEPQIGDTIQARPFGLELWKDSPRVYTGKIIYVNRRHRYYTVQFQLAGGVIRESYKFNGGVMYR